MKISEVINCLEDYANVSLQEDYDNAGLLIGNSDDDCSGILTTLDVTEAVLEEAVRKKCNLIVAHHPVIFKGLKKINGNSYVERAVIAAIKNNIAIYAIHTNLDNVVNGVNQKIAQKLGLLDTQVLVPREGVLKKLVTFCPQVNAEFMRNALFRTGAGSLGKYSECSFNSNGLGTFKAGEGAEPYVGRLEERHEENEVKIEVIFPGYIQSALIRSLKEAHPYEEVAYDIYTLDNRHSGIGSGLVGSFSEPMAAEELFLRLKTAFDLKVIRHTTFPGLQLTKAAVCGGAGIFLLPAAKASGAGVYITSDVKYHEFFDADGTILLADIGHYESEQFTIELLADILQQKFRNFAVLKTEIKTNPVNYYI
ncbi:MAG: Nif3-like dinuclear metal center hexameric protein [Ginsengibacter sp.]